MIIEYDAGGPTPGRITHVVIQHRAELGSHLAGLGRRFIELPFERVNVDRHYVAGAALAPRPAAPATLSKDTIRADGQDAAILSGLPAGWDLTIDGAAQGKTDGSDIEVASATAHAYRIEAAGPWPMLPWTGTVTAV